MPYNHPGGHWNPWNPVHGWRTIAEVDLSFYRFIARGFPVGQIAIALNYHQSHPKIHRCKFSPEPGRGVDETP